MKKETIIVMGMVMMVGPNNYNTIQQHTYITNNTNNTNNTNTNTIISIISTLRSTAEPTDCIAPGTFGFENSKSTPLRKFRNPSMTNFDWGVARYQQEEGERGGRREEESEGSEQQGREEEGGEAGTR